MSKPIKTKSLSSLSLYYDKNDLCDYASRRYKNHNIGKTLFNRYFFGTTPPYFVRHRTASAYMPFMTFYHSNPLGRETGGMASLKGDPSNDSLFDFFEEGNGSSKKQDVKNRPESKVFNNTIDDSTNGLPNTSISASSVPGKTQEWIADVETSQRLDSKCEIKEQRNVSIVSSVTDDRVTPRESSASNYSSDFSSCCSSPVYGKLSASFHSIVEEAENDIIDDKIESVHADNGQCGSSRLSEKEPRSPNEDNTQRPEFQKSINNFSRQSNESQNENLVQDKTYEDSLQKNDNLLEKFSNVSLKSQNCVPVAKSGSKKSISIDEEIKTPKEESTLGSPPRHNDEIQNDQDDKRTNVSPLSKNIKLAEDKRKYGLNSHGNIDDIEIVKQENILENPSHVKTNGETEEANKEDLKIIEKVEINEQEIDLQSSIPKLSKINAEIDELKENVVQTPIPHCQCDVYDIQKSVRKSPQNINCQKNGDIAKKKPEITSPKTEKGGNHQKQRSKLRGNKKNITSGTIASSNNNSKRNPKQKRNRKVTNEFSVEQSANDSVSEAVVNVLKIESKYSYTDFDSHSDPMFMGSSSVSGHSFNSRYSTSLQNSPYRGSTSRNSSSQKGHLSLPVINKTIPGQLIRAGRGNSDSDISADVQNKRKTVGNHGRTKTNDEHRAPQRIGDGGKPKIPVQLKAEAMFRNGQLEVFVTDKDDTKIETQNLNVKITVLHKFIEAKPRMQAIAQQKAGTRTQSRAISKTNRNIINQRAMYPPFNTYTNQEASLRHYNRFA